MKFNSTLGPWDSKSTITNEIGNEIEIAIFSEWNMDLQIKEFVIRITGPKSTSTNEITEAEFFALRKLMGEFKPSSATLVATTL